MGYLNSTIMLLNRFMKYGAFILLVASVAMSGCSKGDSNKLDDPDDNGGYASDISRMEWAVEDAISIVDAAGYYYNGTYMRTTNSFGNCADVATDTLSSPHVLTIRFGGTNCTCADGRERRGNIVVEYDGRFSDTMQVKTITFNNYYINNQQLTGEVKMTRVDTIVTGNWYYKVKTDATLITTENKHITWQGSLVRKWLAGFNTGDRSDNIYSISGSATLTRDNGHVFGCNIQTPLEVRMDCDYIPSGVINVNAYQ
ncbi:MAG: hypothetical protein EBZ77_08005, partial [Chitinophagia bacterium]|nr:hypothetical protein [Chitinophagia bacterium]